MKKISIISALFIFCALICIFIFVCFNHNPQPKPNLADTVTETDLTDNKEDLLSRVGLPNGAIVQTKKASLSSSDTAPSSQSQIHLIVDYDKYNDKIYHDSYLVIETKDGLTIEHIGEDGFGSYGDTLYVCDIDGDRLDEIIVHSTIGMSGGAGQYASRVYSYTGNDLSLIFDSLKDYPFDTGYFAECRDGYEIVILNKFTDYEKIIAYSTAKALFGSYFDENGMVVSQPMMWTDSFFEFIPQDLDGDEIFEIKAVQYASLNGHTNYIGNAVSILKYDTQKGTFDIIETTFEEVSVTQ